MNKEIFKGNWNQLKGTIKTQWGKLTDDDLKVIEGDHQRIYGILQERYGRTKEQVQKDVDTWNSGRAA